MNVSHTTAAVHGDTARLGPLRRQSALDTSNPTLVQSAANAGTTRPNLTRPEAATYLGVKPSTLAAWACNDRVAIPFVKIGRRVMYRLADLEAFCAANVKGAVNNQESQQ